MRNERRGVGANIATPDHVVTVPICDHHAVNAIARRYAVGASCTDRSQHVCIDKSDAYPAGSKRLRNQLVQADSL